MEKYAAYFALIAGPLMFAGLWSFALFVSSAVGGWWKLSNRFRADGPAGGEAFSMLNGRLRCINYSFVLKAALSERGLHLSVLFSSGRSIRRSSSRESIRNVRRESVFFPLRRLRCTGGEALRCDLRRVLDSSGGRAPPAGMTPSRRDILAY